MAIDTIRRYSERPFEIRIIVSGLGLLNSKARDSLLPPEQKSRPARSFHSASP